MHSSLPKVLQPIAAQPLLQHVLKTAQSTQPDQLVIVHGHGGDQVRSCLTNPCYTWVHQAEQKGTAHAVLQAVPHINPSGRVLVLYGDVPLLQSETLEKMLRFPDNLLVLLTQQVENPSGYGRILRHADGRVMGIREEKDASNDERLIREINTGILLIPAPRLADWLARINCNNSQGEYYLTDLVGLAVQDGIAIATVSPEHDWEALGVNDKVQLAHLEKIFQRQQADLLLKSGVTVIDPDHLIVRGSVQCGRDVLLDAGVILEGSVTLGDRVRVGPFCVIRNAHIAADSVIEAFCHIDGATLGGNARIGPYARIRPGTETGLGVHLGNFVEVKNCRLGESTKANHLSYLGDSEVGQRVNVGAGTITCNYDGTNKHRTVIGDDVFIGSDTQLVAPVVVESGATIGAGSTIVRQVPADQLTLSRSKQVTIPGWQRPTKKPR